MASLTKPQRQGSWWRAMWARLPRLNIACVKVKVPYVDAAEIELVIDRRQRQAAWELYIELTTRIATQEIKLDHGLVREALTSLYSLFASTRQILRAAGPAVGARTDSVGGIAITVLNKGLRPFLAKWHPQLAAHEALRQPGTAPGAWERQWSEEARLRGELEKLRSELNQYANALAEMAGVRI